MFRIQVPAPALLPYNPNYLKTHAGSPAMDVDDDEESQPEASTSRVTIPGEAIADVQDWMRGHGSYVEEESIIASVAGQVERVNKLVSVRPFRSKYRPEVGDLVIGRIAEVGPRRWRVELDGRLDAVLMLSSINLPGGVQRRKLESDELQMRTFFQEGDLLVAEVQSILGEGTMSLHTRSLKYGKLRNGQLVIVPPTVIARLKSHFHSLPYGVDVIIGLNGYVWVQAPSKLLKNDRPTGPNDEDWPESSASMAIYSSVNDAVPDETRDKIDRTAACIDVLSRNWITITPSHVEGAYEASLRLAASQGHVIPPSGLHRHAVALIANLAEA